MPLTNTGKEFLTGRVIGDTPIPFDSTRAMLGVGDSSVAFDSSQNDLQGVNKARIPVDAGFPKIDPEDSSNLIFRATFSENIANFEWLEWGIFNSGPSDIGGTMLVRVIDNIGLKIVGSVWVFTAYIKFQN